MNLVARELGKDPAEVRLITISLNRSPFPPQALQPAPLMIAARMPTALKKAMVTSWTIEHLRAEQPRDVRKAN